MLTRTLPLKDIPAEVLALFHKDAARSTKQGKHSKPSAKFPTDASDEEEEEEDEENSPSPAPSLSALSSTPSSQFVYDLSTLPASLSGALMPFQLESVLYDIEHACAHTGFCVR